MKQKMKTIVEHYGWVYQQRMCIEEMSELTYALLVLDEHNEKNVLDDAIEEIADVLLTIGNIKILLGFSEDDLYRSFTAESKDYSWDEVYKPCIKTMSLLTHALCKYERYKDISSIKNEELKRAAISFINELEEKIENLISFLGCSNDVNEIWFRKVNREIGRIEAKKS